MELASPFLQTSTLATLPPLPRLSPTHPHRRIQGEYIREGIARALGEVIKKIDHLRASEPSFVIKGQLTNLRTVLLTPPRIDMTKADAALNSLFRQLNNAWSGQIELLSFEIKVGSICLRYSLPFSFHLAPGLCWFWKMTFSWCHSKDFRPSLIMNVGIKSFIL